MTIDMTMVTLMQTVSKGILKAKMLAYFREVEQTREPLIVMDHHKPVLRIVPYQQKKLPHEVFGKYQSKVIYHEDINTPSSNEWIDL